MDSTAVSTTSVTMDIKEVGAQVLLTDLATMGAGNPADELGTVLGNAIATKGLKDTDKRDLHLATVIGSAFSFVFQNVVQHIC